MTLVDQATQLRSLAKNAGAAVQGTRQGTAAIKAAANSTIAAQGRAGVKRRAKVIAVTSGKGGVGKTNVSVNLAIALASAGKNVVLLDADLGLANADVLCNLDLPCNISHVVAGKREISDAMFKAPGGFRMIGGASGLAKMADLPELHRNRLMTAMAEIEQRAQVIIIDTGAGIHSNVLAFARSADQVVVVTTPEPTSITDAYAVIKVLNRDNVQRHISLTVNQASEQEGANVYQRVSRVARQFLHANLLDGGFVPRDDAVLQAVRQRSPFMLSAPTSRAAIAILQLAMRLEGGVSNVQLEQNGSFFQRFARWFK